MTNVGRDMEKLKPSYVAGENVKDADTGKQSAPRNVKHGVVT